MKLELFGLRVDNLTMEETLARIDEFIASRTVHHHVVINVDKIVKAHRDPKLRDIINACDLVNVDGQPVVWDLVLRSPNRFAWHRTDWESWATTRDLRRCP